MPAAQHVLEEAEEQLDRPSLAIQLGNDFGGQVEEIRGDPQDAVRGRAGLAARVLPRRAGVVRLAPAAPVIGPRGGAGGTERDELIFKHARGFGLGRERPVSTTS